MIRVSIIVGVLLMLSVNAKPLNKPSDEHLEQRVVFIDDKGKLSWGAEVEPPEDMDRIEYEVDPRMRIWNSGQEKHYLKPEEDLDEIYHPSIVELQAQVREFGYQAQGKEDDQHSPAQMEQVVYLQPEEDMDDTYHKEPLLPALQRDVAEAAAPVDLPSQRKYTEPEEDLDDLYHRRFDMPVLQQKVAEAPVDIPSQRKYTKPEEDLDGLYHQ
ncbi:uncharacterized protein LOC106944805 [Poecilia latipinna]|uniref:uncharacterized protein LOC106944805 n=1 Tax=Poecilia latipinna TaxID=48699 RepID=UPI00072E992E|nr:PREDICTED: uncharacterized protein LOC106944805 [Poecilia latipinna]